MLLGASVLPGCKSCDWQQAACMPCPHSGPYFGEYNYMPVPVPVVMGACPPESLPPAAPMAPPSHPAVPPAPAAEEPIPTPNAAPPKLEEMSVPLAPPEFLPPISLPSQPLPSPGK
jgi:hypothetical protein